MQDCYEYGKIFFSGKDIEKEVPFELVSEKKIGIYWAYKLDNRHHGSKSVCEQSKCSGGMVGSSVWHSYIRVKSGEKGSQEAFPVLLRYLDFILWAFGNKEISRCFTK